MSKINFLVSPGRRLAMLALTFVVGIVVTIVVSKLLFSIGGENKYLAMLRIGAVVQDIFLFIVPALLTAVIVTRQPVRLLALAKLPTPMTSLLAVAVLLFSSPLMSWIIELNNNVHFPESLAGLEKQLRVWETANGGTVDSMLGPNTPLNLAINVMIVGIMAGFSEELFFRGALQRLLASTPMRRWAAVWISAALFSALHFQFFGFIPRMLLGAFFGYLLVWSGSVWLPMMLHMFNNSMFVILQYATGHGEPSFDALPRPASIAISALLTAAGIWLLWRNKINNNQDQQTKNQ